MTNLVETKIEAGQEFTSDDVATDLNSGNWDALYFAKERMILDLIEANRIDEDFYSRHQEYQEEMRIMVAEGV